jgi:hypothetical protein
MQCGKPMRLNVPRMGYICGFVHADTGAFDCGPSEPLAFTYGIVPGTPRTDAVMQDNNRDGNDLPDLCRTMEREIAMLNQRLIDRTASYTAQVVRIESVWRDKLAAERASHR